MGSITQNCISIFLSPPTNSVGFVKWQSLRFTLFNYKKEIKILINTVDEPHILTASLVQNILKWQ